MEEKKILFIKGKNTKSTKLEEDDTMPEENSCALSEIIILTTACLLMITMTIGLFMNMTDDWTADPEIRNRVLILALILFSLNIIFCCYMTRRLGVQICRPQYDIESNLSVNSHLLAHDLPPSYEAVVISNTIMINPPAYEEVRRTITTFDSVQVHHKATG